LLRTSQFPWRGYVTFTDVKWGEVLFNLKVNVSSSLGGRRLEWTFDKFSKAKTKTRFYSFRKKKPNTMMHHSCPRECIFCDGTFPGCGHYLSLSREAFEAERDRHAKIKAKAKTIIAEGKVICAKFSMRAAIFIVQDEAKKLATSHQSPS
jgi:hypothetical protein